MFTFTRRSLLIGLSAASIFSVQGLSAARKLVIHKDPNCGCCTGWVEHVRAAGFETHVNELADLAPVKARLGVPTPLASCHTAEIDGYVIEGHVPAAAINRLLLARPTAVGLAVPGMPVGSPGMEVPGAEDETYDVILFGPSGQRTFAKFKGTQQLA